MRCGPGILIFDFVKNDRMPDFTSFENCLQRFSEALQAYSEDAQNTLYRDACIQRFKFSYDLSHKLLKRYLEITSTNPTEVDAFAFQDLIRSGNAQGLLLHDWKRWKNYRNARNITGQTYDEDKAIEIIAILPEFLLEAQSLLQELKIRNNLRA